MQFSQPYDPNHQDESEIAADIAYVEAIDNAVALIVADSKCYADPEVAGSVFQLSVAVGQLIQGKWRDIGKAPRDGTVIELRIVGRYATTYGVYSWKPDLGWRSAQGSDVGVAPSCRLFWRPYNGAPHDYTGPVSRQPAPHFPSPCDDIILSPSWADEVKLRQQGRWRNENNSYDPPEPGSFRRWLRGLFPW